MKTLEELKLLADAGNAQAQYELSVLYQKEGNDAEAYRYCTEAAIKNNFTQAYRDLALMYINGKTPVWDAIIVDKLLEKAQGVDQAEQHDIIKNHEELQDLIEEFRPYAKVNPHKSLEQVPLIKGIKASLKEFIEDFKDDKLGFLCGRLGPYSRYPMVILRRSNEFCSMTGMNGMENPTNGLCIVLTFAQIGKEPTTGNLREAFFHRVFKELDIYEGFTCHISSDMNSSGSGPVTNIYEYTMDCGFDYEKAESVVSSILYHLYGYKKNRLIYPAISFIPDFKQLMVGPDGKFVKFNKESDGARILMCGLENFTKLDFIITAVGYGIWFYFWGSTSSVFVITLVFILWIILMLSFGQLLFTNSFKTLKRPKINHYYEFVNNPTIMMLTQ